MNVKNKLPQGWVECELGKIFLIERGGSPRPIKNYLTDDKNGINWIKIGDVQKNSKYIYSTKEKIKPEGKKHSRFVSDGDLILSNSMSFGRPYILRTSGCIHDGWVVFRNIYKLAYEDFLYYILSSQNIYNEFAKVATGSTVKNLNIDRIKPIKIKIPPINEQKRIVEKIEKEFGKLDEGVEKLKLAQEQIKLYRQSVLKAAFGGSLFPLSTSKDFVLDDIAEITSSKRVYKDDYVKNGVPFYRTKEIKELAHNLPISLELFISDDKYNEFKEKYGVPNTGDILISAVGTIGEIYVVKNSDKFYFKDGNILWLRNYKTNIDQSYLKYLLRFHVSSIQNLTQGAAYNALTIEKLKQFKVTLPLDIDEQKQIVREIEKRFEVADEVERVITENLEKTEQLKQSILKKAFEGRLVPQDPTDQPASELLAQIQAERNK